MRTALLVLAATALGSRMATAQQRVEERRAAAADLSLRIFTTAGSIRVTGWDRDSVVVSGTVDSAAGRFVIGGTAQALKLGVEPPEGKPVAGTADLDVRVPRGARVWLKGITAELEVSDVTGNVDAITVSGRIRVSGAPKSVSAESIEGNVELVVQSPVARAKSASGTVVLRGVILDAIASSVSGPVYIGMEGAIQRGHFETVSGEVAFKGGLAADGVLEAESHSGNVELRLPAELGAEYDVSAFGGVVRNELSTARADPHGELHFTVGNGKAHVSVRTFKGVVELKKK